MKKQFEKGDLVRIKSDSYYFRKGEVYTIKEMYLSGTIRLFDNWGVTSDNLKPATHLTTKEFIKLVEDMGYEANEYKNGIEVRGINGTVGEVFKNDVNVINTNFRHSCSQKLFKVLTLYSSTPLELRGEKEQLYTLELPNTNSCYRYYVRDNYEYLFDDIHDDNGYQHKFTQKEIDNLPNQELIRTLKQEPVK